ncbi:FAD-dependent oxidoreductase [Frankia sp. Cas4]|uniref:FAD-dependent oxidoreductase n=1 Tax=Frankia sp. Cas4 TaxID=3073927 RepID=UPI002AD4F654|nr:FAD-dependent oxidoreductase [Frankia sp. Cas4]
MLNGSHDVVVVGAGIAGLSVTAALAGAGADVVCIEARERVGGRQPPGVARSRRHLVLAW